MKPSIQSTMKKVRSAFEQSGLSLDELGRKMEAEEKTARQTAWQFLNKTADPRLSMLIRFAEALDVEVKDLL
jgi:transcriptional regulator with XRE-family HTH domain